MFAAPTQPSDSRAPQAIGPYSVQRQIGRGGSGVVFEGVAPDGRRVAIKLLTAPDVGRRLQRFAREERLLRDLTAEGGFVPLLDRGDSPWGPYLVMPFLAGGTLGARLRSGPLPGPEAIRVVSALAAALARAHSRGVVHRDLKPDNVLFDEGGQPLIADLGIAKSEEEVALSRTGETMGTWGYMAPEQVQDAKSVGPAADVFSLGVLLHECLTGRPAFPDSDPQAVMVAIGSRRVERLRALRPDLPAALEQLVLRALDPDPRQRPADAGQLARALAEAVGRPARRPSRAWGHFAAGAGVGGLLVLLAWWASGPVRSPPPPPQDVAPVATAPSTGGPRLERIASWGRPASHFQMVNALAVSPATGVVASGALDGLLVLEDLTSGVEIETTRAHGGIIHALEFSPDGAVLLSVADDGLRAWRGNDLAPLAVPASATGRPLYSVELLPDGRWLFGTTRGEVLVWDLSQEAPLARFAVDTEEGCQAHASPDGRLLFVQHGARVDVLDRDSGERKLTLTAPDTIMACDVSPDGTLVAAVTGKGWLVAWDLPTGTQRARIHAISPQRNRSYGHARSLRFLPGLPGVLVGGDDDAVRAWDLESGTERLTLIGHVGWVEDLRVLPDGRVLTGGNDQTVRLWSLLDECELRPRQGHAGNVRRVAWSADGRRAYSVGWDRFLHVWDVESGRELELHRGGTGATALAIAPGGRLVTGGARLWSFSAQGGETQEPVERPLHTIEPLGAREGALLLVDAEGRLRSRGLEPAWEVDLGPEVAGVRAALSPSGEALLLVGTRGVASLLLLPPSAGASALPLSTPPVQAGLFLDPSLLLLGGVDGRLHRVRLDGTSLPPLGEAGAGINCLASARPSGGPALAAAGTADGWVHLWDLDQGRRLDRLELGKDLALDLAFSPAGDELLVGTLRGQVLRVRVTSRAP